MDVFLKEKDFYRATLAAHEILLQEENQNELTLAACLVSCMNYVKHLKDNKQDFHVAKKEDLDEDKPKVLI
jgi:hypothetical protein